MLDLYPEASRGFIRVLCTVQSAGIVAEIRKKNKMDESDAFRYRRFLEDNYGMSGELVNNALLLWKSVLIKPDKIQEGQSASPAIQLSEKKIPFTPVSETEDDEESDYAEGPEKNRTRNTILTTPRYMNHMKMTMLTGRGNRSATMDIVITKMNTTPTHRDMTRQIIRIIIGKMYLIKKSQFAV